jgi:hypothetical protein
MHELEGMALSTYTRKRRFKSLFRYSSRKELQRARHDSKKS